jgi:hypothetical protein
MNWTFPALFTVLTVSFVLVCVGAAHARPLPPEAVLAR